MRKMKRSKVAPKSEQPQLIDEEETPQRLWGWIVLFVSATILLAVTAFIAHRHTLSGLDLSIFRHINDWPDKLRTFFLVATIVPESLWIGVAAVIVVFALKMYRAVWQLAVCIFAGGAAAYIGKHVIDQPRPAELVSGVHLRVHETGMGFPSGHTMVITVVVLALWPYLPRGWRWLALLLIPLMAVSRVYLGVHSPLDVVGGFAVGAVVVSGLQILLAIVRKFSKV